MFDYLAVGHGFASSVSAGLPASQQNENALIIDKRNHVGGNINDQSGRGSSINDIRTNHTAEMRVREAS